MVEATRATHVPKIMRSINWAMTVVSGRRLARAIAAAGTCAVGLIPTLASAEPGAATVTADKTTFGKGEIVSFSTTNTEPSQFAAIFLGQGPSDASTVHYDSLTVNLLTDPVVGYRWCRFDGLGDSTQPRTLTVRLYNDFEGDGSMADDFIPRFDDGSFVAQVQVTLAASTNECPWADSLEMGTVGQEYNSTVGAVIAFYALANGTLPPGLTLNDDGTITGAPSDAGEFTFTVYADDFFRDYLKEFTIVVNEPSSPPTNEPTSPPSRGWPSLTLRLPEALPATL